ncbi:MAG: methyl-accepting chemotaxis protein, partial [Rhodoferax sp.]|nr:methyl-accepting chemotaxis protein [Rhodoferax sp.]
SNEQSTGVSQVGEAITQMDQTTQQNAALVEQMAAAASSLKSQAHELVQVVAVFQLSQDMHSPHGGAFAPDAKTAPSSASQALAQILPKAPVRARSPQQLNYAGPERRAPEMAKNTASRGAPPRQAGSTARPAPKTDKPIPPKPSTPAARADERQAQAKGDDDWETF